MVACYSGGDDFVTVSSSGSALFRAGQIIHEGTHKHLYDGGWDEGADYQTHEMVAHYAEFQFYRSFDVIARRDPDLKKDYPWYVQRPNEFLTYVCSVRYQFNHCKP